MFLSRLRGNDHKVSHPSQDPGGVRVLARWQIAANHLLGTATDRLRSALVLGSVSIPDGDGGGENTLNDGSVEVHHHCQLNSIQLYSYTYTFTQVYSLRKSLYVGLTHDKQYINSAKDNTEN